MIMFARKLCRIARCLAAGATQRRAKIKQALALLCNVKFPTILSKSRDAQTIPFEAIRLDESFSFGSLGLIRRRHSMFAARESNATSFKEPPAALATTTSLPSCEGQTSCPLGSIWNWELDS